MFACFECGAKYHDRVKFCPICLETNTVIEYPEEGKVFFQTRQRKIFTAKELAEKHQQGKKIQSFEYLGDLPENDWTLLVYGLPGEGKSTYALLLSDALQEKTLYFAVEEGHSESIIRKLLQWEIRSDFISISDARDTREVRQDITEYQPSLIVIDSITALGSTLKHNKTIWVAQSTKAGDFRGNQEIAHDADIVLCLAGGKAIVEKNRFGLTGSFKFKEEEI